MRVRRNIRKTGKVRIEFLMIFRTRWFNVQDRLDNIKSIETAYTENTQLRGRMDSGETQLNRTTHIRIN